MEKHHYLSQPKTCRPIPLLVFAAVILGGCSADERTSVVSSPVTPRLANAVFLQDTCPVTGKVDAPASEAQRPPPVAAPLMVQTLTFLIPAVANFVVGLAREYLSQMNRERSGFFLATGVGIGPSGSTGANADAYRCLIVMRASLGEGSPPGGSEADRAADGSRAATALRSAIPAVMGSPNFYFEARLRTFRTVKSGQTSAQILAFEPRLLWYRETSASRAPLEPRFVSMTIALQSTQIQQQAFVGRPPTSGSTPTLPAPGEGGALLTLNFGKLRPGTLYRIPDQTALPGFEELLDAAATRSPFPDLIRLAVMPDPAGGGRAVWNLGALVIEDAERDPLIETLLDTPGAANVNKAVVFLLEELLAAARGRSRP